MARRVWGNCRDCWYTKAAHDKPHGAPCSEYRGEVIDWKLSPKERQLRFERAERKDGALMLPPSRLGRHVRRSVRYGGTASALEDARHELGWLHEVAARWRSRIAGDLIVTRAHRWDDRASAACDPKTSRRELARVERETERTVRFIATYG